MASNEQPAAADHDKDKDPSGVTDEATEEADKKQDGPAGGFDDTPIPSPPPGTDGYTLKFVFHQATNLAMGDAHTFSSDPFVLAQLDTDLPTRHKEDPNLRYRSHTIHKDVEPEWNAEWIVANVPSTGFKLKVRIYDEDAADHDDLLGKVHITVPQIDDDWKGFKLAPHQLTLRDSSKRALLIRGVARTLRLVDHMRGEIYISIRNLGRTGDDGQNGRPYTVGPCRWFQHYSPILGRITNTKDSKKDHVVQNGPDGEPQKKAQRYNFQANQMQLPGPIPAQLYHRFVEFKPWVKRMFTTKGFSGVVLGKALHHQHARVYDFGRATTWGELPEGPSIEQTKKFLELVHYDTAGRIFTYVLTLDALWRFTETGKEFGIDMLSKHTMHSDVSIYIAFSGEFFVRRVRKRRPDAQSIQSSGSVTSQGSATPSANNLNGVTSNEEPSKDPSNYELVIDNDSGTYRPNAAMLPLLSEFLSRCLPGLHVQTLDCQADAEKMAKLKAAQRERKKAEGANIVYAQVSDSSSISSSDDERLDEVHEAFAAQELEDESEKKERGTLATFAKDVKRQQESRVQKFVRNVTGRPELEGEKEKEG